MMGESGPNLPNISITTPSAPPRWAILERELIDKLNAAAPEFVARYTRDDGSLIWRDEWAGMDGSDDPYEAFMYLALFYSVGGSDEVYVAARRMWDAITWQWTQYGQIEREFDGGYDWMHHGESNLFHYFFGLTKPDSLVDRQRADQFARMYTGEDPLAPNYDQELRLIRAPLTGSRGPRFVVRAEDMSMNRGVLDDYLPPFEDLETSPFPSDTCNWSSDAVFAEIIEKMNERMTHGDVPLNLNATSQMAHAFMYSGDVALRDWVTGYLETWQRRAEGNGSIIPDNVGLSGQIGEYFDGKWWGGYYGWRWPHGFLTIIEPIINAGINAMLLTGKQSYLDLARQQLDKNFALGHEEEGRWLVPHKHFDSGWADLRDAEPFHAIHLWARSLAPEDLERVERVPKHFDWSEVRIPRKPLATKHYNVNTLAWYEYARGRNPGYPERAIEANLELLAQQLRRMRSEEGDPRSWPELSYIDGYTDNYDLQVDSYAIHAWQEFCPVYFESLVQLTWGAPMHISHGGLQHSTVRYFDAGRERPGLPESVAALVHVIGLDHVEIELVNLSTSASRAVVIQAGAFGEHRFGTASVGSDEAPTPVNGKWFEVALAPATGVKLSLTMERYVLSPSYETPWSRRADWSPLIQSRRPGPPADGRK